MEVAPLVLTVEVKIVVVVVDMMVIGTLVV